MLVLRIGIGLALLRICQQFKISLNLKVGKMRLLRSFLTLSLSFSILCLSFANSYSEERSWNDYREPVQDIRVIHKEKTTIYVDIPDDFIVNKNELTLIVRVQSNTYPTTALKREFGFHNFYPSLKVNDHLFGLYRIPVKSLPAAQTREVKIKTKHLNPGINKLQAIFKWKKEGNWCASALCTYTIKEMYFKNAPPLLNTLAISSDPQGAKIYIGGHFHGETPKDVQVGKGRHNIKIEKAGYQISLDDIEVLEDDEYFIELEPDSSIFADYQKIIGHWWMEGDLWMEGESMVIEEIDNRLSIRMDRLRGYHLGPSGQAKYRETTHSHNISWDGKHLEFEIWMPSGAGAYEVSYSLTLSGPNTLFGTKQASGSSLKIEVEFEKE